MMEYDDWMRLDVGFKIVMLEGEPSELLIGDYGQMLRVVSHLRVKQRMFKVLRYHSCMSHFDIIGKFDLTNTPSL